jgi:4-hydroxy-4-methyl-2-oxoglutarate aldolase
MLFSMDSLDETGQMSSQQPIVDQLAALRSLGSATVYEAQGAFGALDSAIKPLDPRSRLAAPAFTVDMRPADNLMLHYALLKARPGEVLVVDAKAFVEAGPWGDVLTAMAQKVGIAGLVINGAVRDAQAIVDAGFPVWCRGLSIKGTAKNQSGRVNVPITIGDVVIHAGDIVVADRDGIAVVPADRIDAVLAAALDREQKEGRMREAIAQGATTADLLDLTTTLRRLGLE